MYDNSTDLATPCLSALGIALGFVFANRAPLIVSLGSALGVLLLPAVILRTQSLRP